MFCPICKYEFRRGFARCNTCDACKAVAMAIDRP